jgi:hypothetical protein
LDGVRRAGPSDPARLGAWRAGRRAFDERVAAEAERLARRAARCAYFGLTRAEHDALTFDELRVYDQVLTQGPDRER